MRRARRMRCDAGFAKVASQSNFAIATGDATLGRMRIPLCALLVAACTSSPHHPPPHGIDAPPGFDAPIDACNPLLQVGCAVGQKCTWVTDATTPQPLGHIDCVPDGTVDTGGACTQGTPGPMGYDNCKKGNYCQGMKCKLICDPQGGSPMCPTSFACSTYEGLFGPVGQPVAAGVCDATCDPLADNKFGSNKTKTGATCAATQGCYGYPNDAAPSQYTCTSEVNVSQYHRAACTTASGCANASGSPYLNGCAQGFIPLLYDMTGSMQVDCISLCKPADCYLGNCTTGAATNIIGSPTAPTHRCNSTDSSGSFNPATPGATGNNGDQCMFSWLFEVDTMGHFVRSATSDTLGFCVDHSKYKYDSNGDGQVTSADLAWPKCDTFTQPGQGTGSAVGGVCNDVNNCIHAADFGCVSTMTGGIMFEGKPAVKPAVVIDRPRVPYSRLVR